MSQLKVILESTYKSRDTEEFLDIFFYRPIGYFLALISKNIGVTPNHVTIFSIYVGVLAGHFYYYNDLMLNLIGILLLIFAEALDSADGILARITNSKSRYGRILDGFGGNLWFVSIYIHLCFRYINSGGTPLIFLFALVCGASHSLQSAMADYYRNFYMFFKYGKNKSEIDDSNQIRKEYEQLSWKREFKKKFLLRIYLNYTIEQEMFSNKLRALYNLVRTKYGNEIPEWLSQEYSKSDKPLIKYYNILTTNTRMIVLFIALLIGLPGIYWVFEFTILNILMIYVFVKKENYSAFLLSKVEKSE